MDKQAVLFAAQQATFRESRVEKELSNWLRNELTSAEKKAEETREARLEAIHERYAPSLRKFTDLYSRKEERQKKALRRAEDLKLELAKEIADRVADVKAEKEAAHAISHRISDYDLAVQVEKERADTATTRQGNPNIKELRKASRRIRRIDAELKEMDLDVGQKQEAALISYRIRMLDARLAPLLQGDNPTEKELEACDAPDPPKDPSKESDSIKRKRRKWREDEHRFRTELAASLVTLVDELEVDAKKRFQDALAEERRIIERKYGNKIKLVNKLIADYTAETSTVKLALLQLPPLQEVYWGVKCELERMKNKTDVSMHSRIRATRNHIKDKLLPALAFVEESGTGTPYKACELQCYIEECDLRDEELKGVNIVLPRPNLPSPPSPLSPVHEEPKRDRPPLAA